MEEEQEEVEFYHHHHYSSPEVCSKREAEEDEEELELGLSLGARKSGKGGGGGQWGEYCRILTAKDFPCVGGSRVSSNSSSASSSFSLGGRRGSKRGDESVAHEIGTNTPNQLVGWPPIRARRINNLFNQSKANEQEKTPITRKSIRNNTIPDNDLSPRAYEKKPRSQFVKINMDGVPIGRKVDLSVHRSYDTLALVLEDMFQDVHSFKIPLKSIKASKLLDGSSEFVLTYEDKDGDWMLVGDVPWRMFLSSVRRLRIMKTSDANGLAPRLQSSNNRLRNKQM